MGDPGKSTETGDPVVSLPTHAGLSQHRVCCVAIPGET